MTLSILFHFKRVLKQMTTQDIFYVVASIAITLFIVGAIIVWYHIIQTLKKIQLIADRIGDTVGDMGFFKDGLKLGFFGIISKILGSARR